MPDKTSNYTAIAHFCNSFFTTPIYQPKTAEKPFKIRIKQKRFISQSPKKA
jgi:hypothetical protein